MDSATLACLDLQSWRIATAQELRSFHEDVLSRKRREQSMLAVRRSLSPVDVYCYLKARFGEPNGFQTFLRGDHSENWIHWDFNLKSGREDVYICGTSREIHFIVSTRMSDDNWRDLISALKTDFGRVGNEKKVVLKSLEKWVIFPNKFVDVAEVCAELYADIRANSGSFKSYETPPAGEEGRDQQKKVKRLLERLSKAHRSSLELSLLTPILAEAFINMTILILCKPEIRNNARQFDEFIRSNIDVKLFDMPYKCRGFVRGINPHSESFKKFKRIMDRRNHIIHGNIDPEREQLETVYFEGKRPLFVEPGDHIGKFLESRERQYRPDEIARDYEDTYAFLNDIPEHLEPELIAGFRRTIEAHYPGYDVGRKKMGVLFSDYVAVGRVEGTRYDDDLI